MRLYNFFATIHLDRFRDLALLIGGLQVIVEPYAVGEDSTVQVFIVGEASTTLNLDRNIQRIKHILAAPVSMESFNE